YSDHLLATAARGDLLLTLAAILPCQWGYREIGRALMAGSTPDDPRYAGWIAEYASAAYSELVDWLIQRFDALADAAGAASRDAGPRDAIGQDDAHDAGLANEPALLIAPQRGGHQAWLNLIELRAGVAQTSHLDHRGVAEVQACPGRQVKQRDAASGDVLAHL